MLRTSTSAVLFITLGNIYIPHFKNIERITLYPPDIIALERCLLFTRTLAYNYCIIRVKNTMHLLSLCPVEVPVWHERNQMELVYLQEKTITLV